MTAIDPLKLLTPRRTIMGISAVLLPFQENGDIDWTGYLAHLDRTIQAGLIPAINMDTGYGPLLSETERLLVLQRSSQHLRGTRFAAGVCVRDQPGSPYQQDEYIQQLGQISSLGGIPVVCQSHGLTALPESELIQAYETLGSKVNEFIAFELGTMFAPFGKIYSLEVYTELMRIHSCIGAKHSSLSRELEWQRLQLRNTVRPEFRVFTGNDLAIDMVMYGSDYLLGLSTFAPQYFALRDKYWADGDARFYELNDTLQYLGHFTFRAPVPAYKHSAAQFLHHLGWIASSRTHPRSPERPASDVAVLQSIARQLGSSSPTR